MTFARFVIVTGLSGAGKSQAMKSFEDLGFYCLDNLPPALVPGLVDLCRAAGIERIALSLDVRIRGPFGEALAALGALDERGVAFDLLFLEASDEAIVRRYSETRRRHPREGDGSLSAAIARERDELAPLRTLATRIWDTSHLTQATLKGRVRAGYAGASSGDRMSVGVVAFGFKFGVPVDADLVFDVRFFVNPNYVPELKALTGADRAVADFIAALPETRPYLEHLFGMIDFLIPRYIAEGKSRLTIAIGCTGGRHRSVYVADRLASHLEHHAAISIVRSDRELGPR
ncbi:MAG: RNase adapter RapZ [Vulcanimicrobiaceae bacterium]